MPPGTVRVRTFHAFGREILRAAGRPVDPLVDREALLRADPPGPTRPSGAGSTPSFSTLKLEHRRDPADVAADPDAGPRARAFVAYERALADAGGLDFDDLVARALALLEADPDVLRRWRSACVELLVDEVQDVDRSQLELALLIAAPANRIFLVGDDDQSIYGWRLADVRRVLDLAGRLPGLRRHDLITNFRCPAPVVERAVRLVEHNTRAVRQADRCAARRRRAARPRAGPGRRRRTRLPRPRQLVERHQATDGQDDARRSSPARTASSCPRPPSRLELGLPFRAERSSLPLDDPRLDDLLAAADSHGRRAAPRSDRGDAGT